MEEDNQQAIQHEGDQERVAVGEFQQGRLRVRSVGKRITLSGGIYGHVNHYIRQSRKYFPHRRLRTFAYFYYMPYIYIALIFPGSLLCFHFTTSLLLAEFHLCFFLLYCQHVYVCLGTLRYVQMQPTAPNHSMTLANEHKEIDFEEYQMRFAATSNVGVGFVTHSAGKIKYQVFRQSSKEQLRRVTAMSLAGVLTSFLAWLVCTIIGIALLL